jgi:hypothetical protein
MVEITSHNTNRLALVVAGEAVALQSGASRDDRR